MSEIPNNNNSEKATLPAIYLTEDNAGGLLIGNLELGWWDVTAVQESSCFDDDASALANGDIADWTVDHYPLNDDRNTTVAIWWNGSRSVISHCGTAAKNYLRIEEQ